MYKPSSISALLAGMVLFILAAASGFSWVLTVAQGRRMTTAYYFNAATPVRLRQEHTLRLDRGSNKDIIFVMATDFGLHVSLGRA